MSRHPDLSALIQEYLEDLAVRGRAPSTAAAYERYLRDFRLWLARERGRRESRVGLADLSEDLLRRWQLHEIRRRGARSGRQLAAGTRNVRAIAIRQLLRYARRRGLRCPDPERSLELARERDIEVRGLERREYRRIMAAIAASPTTLRDRAIVGTLYGTGIRVSELVALQSRSVDLRERRVTIVGKGGRERLVLFTREAAALLVRYLKRRHDHSRYLFVASRRVDANGDPAPLSVRTVQQVVDEAARRAELPFRVSPHRFRHARLSIVARHVGVVVAQRIAGHASLRTTSRYLHVSDPQLERAFDQAERKDGGK